MVEAVAVTRSQVTSSENGVSPANGYRKIGLLDHMGFGNMGDAAVHESFLQNIKKRLPDAVVVSFSQNPDDTKKRHNIQAFPISWNYPGRNGSGEARTSLPRLSLRFRSLVKQLPILYKGGKRLHNFYQELAHLLRSFHVVRSLDLLVISGGGQLCDLWWLQPYNVFKFCVLARLSGTPVFIVGVGADLIRARSSRFYARWAVRLATYVSFRDRESQDLIRNLGVTRETHVCPDPAYGLDPQDYQISNSENSHNPRVGLNPMGFCDPRVWPQQDVAAYNSYIDKLATFSSWLLAEGYDLELFTSDIGVDKYAIEDLKDRILLNNCVDSRRVVCRPILNLPGLLSQIASFDFVITSKFHGVVFSHILGKPVLALSYLPKIDYLIRRAGHDKYCMSIDKADVPLLVGTFTSMVRERDRLQQLFLTTSLTYANALQAEFDNLLFRSVR